MTKLKQGWDKARTTEELEDGVTYKYYILGGSRPVRVKLSCRGFEIGAETIDRTTGRFKRDHTLLSRLDLSWEVEEVDKERFEEFCKEFLQKKE